jgi:uncharacterized protein
VPLHDPTTAAAAEWPPPLPVASSMTAGWYDDPHGHSELRWWDGAGWTDHEHGARTVSLRAAAIGLGVLLLSRVGVEVAIAPLRDSAVPVWVLALGFYVLVFGGMVAAARVALWPGRSFGSWLRPQLRAADAGRGLLVWLTAMGTAIVTVTLIRTIGAPFRSNGDVVAVYRDRDAALFTVTALAAVIGAPLVEELFFRGLVLGGLRSRLPVGVAVAVQAVLFGVYHVIPSYGTANVGLVIVLTGYGAAFGAWAVRAGRLGPTMVGHALTNSLALVALLAR